MISSYSYPIVSLIDIDSNMGLTVDCMPYKPSRKHPDGALKIFSKVFVKEFGIKHPSTP